MRYVFIVFAWVIGMPNVEAKGLSETQLSAREALDAIDDYFQDRQLLKSRIPGAGATLHASDRCLTDPEVFADPIGVYVDQAFNPSRPSLGGNESVFALPSNANALVPVSLVSHPLCALDKPTLAKILRREPSNQTVALAQAFVKKANELRSRIRLNAAGARADGIRFWSRLMGCLSYTESLTTADTSSSERIAREVAPADYRRPAGVLFYKDPRQNNPVSALNIGLYQFSPASDGNIQGCIRDWNKSFPACPISKTASKSEMIRTLGANLQSFNAYCGMQKILHPFFVQANTRQASITAPANFSGGTLKPGADRCLSLHVKGAYVHFGPLLDTTGRNLQEVLACALSE